MAFNYVSVWALTMMAAEYVPYWTENRVWQRLDLWTAKVIAADALIVRRPGSIVQDTLVLSQFCKKGLDNSEEARQIFSSLRPKLIKHGIEKVNKGSLANVDHSFPRMRNGRPFYIDAE